MGIPWASLSWGPTCSHLTGPCSPRRQPLALSPPTPVRVQKRRQSRVTGPGSRHHSKGCLPRVPPASPGGARPSSLLQKPV